MRDANLDIVFAERPAVVAGHAFTTGWIPQTTFEKPLNSSIMTVGVRSGMGCDADKLPLDKQSATSIPDDFQHGLDRHALHIGRLIARAALAETKSRRVVKMSTFEHASFAGARQRLATGRSAFAR